MKPTLFLAVLLIAACTVSPGQKAKSVTAIATEERDVAQFSQLLIGVPPEQHDEIAAEVDKLLADATKGYEPPYEPRKLSLLVAWYLHSHFASVDADPFSILQMLKDRQALCGGTAIAYQLVMRRAGFETRTGGLFGIPIQGGHVVTEVRWDGKWHFVDPTFGVFFTDNGRLDGELLDLATILKYREAIAPNAFYPVSLGRIGRDYPAAPPPYEEMFKKEQTSMIRSGNYHLFLSNIHAGTSYTAETPLLTPYSFPLTDSAPIVVGEVDESDMDILRHLNAAGWYDASSMAFLGDSSGTHGTLFNSHLYEVSHLEPGERFTLALYLVAGQPEAIEITPRKATLLSVDYRENHLVATFEAKQSRVEIGLQTKDRIRFDSIQIGR